MVVRVGGTSSASGHVKVSARPSDLPRFPGICRSPVPPLEELDERARGKKVRMLGVTHSFTMCLRVSVSCRRSYKVAAQSVNFFVDSSCRHRYEKATGLVWRRLVLGSGCR